MPPKSSIYLTSQPPPVLHGPFSDNRSVSLFSVECWKDTTQVFRYVPDAGASGMSLEIRCGSLLLKHTIVSTHLLVSRESSDAVASRAIVLRVPDLDN
jgi:hypothetical protein